MEECKDKSYVGMTYDLCPVCLDKTNEGVALDKHLKDTLCKDNYTGEWTMCKLHEQQLADGYIFLIALKDVENPTNNMTLEDTANNRTGEVAAIKRDKAVEIFNSGVNTINFCDIETIESLQTLQEN